MKLSHPATMRALAHPLRIELLERLALQSEATASELAPLVGSTPSNCSFHLRKLAEAGFIERVPGATGRDRPWRVVEYEQSWSTDPTDAEDVAQAKTALNSSFREWEFARIRQAETLPNPAEWRGALGTNGATLYLTPEETEQAAAEIAAIVRRYVPRWNRPDLRPEGARPVRLYSTLYLVRAADSSQGGGAAGAGTDGAAGAGAP